MRVPPCMDLEFIGGECPPQTTLQSDLRRKLKFSDRFSYINVDGRGHRFFVDSFNASLMRYPAYLFSNVCECLLFSVADIEQMEAFFGIGNGFSHRTYDIINIYKIANNFLSGNFNYASSFYRLCH